MLIALDGNQLDMDSENFRQSTQVLEQAQRSVERWWSLK